MRSLLFTTALLSLSASIVSAQWPEPGAWPVPGTLLAPIAAASPPRDAHEARTGERWHGDPARMRIDERSTALRSGSHSLLHALGGAVVGAWIGYFASQLVASDWDSNVAIDRATWAAGGALVGTVSGFAVSTAIGGGSGARPAAVPGRRGAVITTAEIRQAGKQNVYDLVAALRPDWLITRGVHSMRETPRGQSVGNGVLITDPGAPTIIVYLDGARLGGVEALRQISPAEVTVLEFLTPAEASQRFGAGHSHGAIVVSTA